MLHNILFKFTEFFLVGTIATALYFIGVMVYQRIFFGRSDAAAGNEGNLPWGILVAFLNLGIALVFWFWVNQLAINITPQFVNIR